MWWQNTRNSRKLLGVQFRRDGDTMDLSSFVALALMVRIKHYDHVFY